MVELWPGGSYEIVPFPPERKAIDIGDYYSDFSLIQGELGWTPRRRPARRAAGARSTTTASTTGATGLRTMRDP